MIIYNEFKEFDREAREIDRELFYVNLYIYRDNKNTVPYNKYGEIHIPDYGDKTIFCGLLIHEAGHSVYDPITMYNYIKSLYEVKKQLGINDKLCAIIGNVISDIINDYSISKNAKLRKYRVQYLRKVFNQWFDPNDRLKSLLWAFYDRVHGCNLKFSKQKYSKYVKEIINVLENTPDRDERYVKISKIIYEFLNEKRGKDGENGDGYSGDTYDDIYYQDVETPLKADRNEIENTIKQIYKNAEDFEEAKNMIKILLIFSEDSRDIITKSFSDLRSFYQEKANSIRSFISYPKTIEHKGVKLGSRKWSLSDGLDKLDVKRTILKSGVNIPLVTSKTARILDRFISSRESNKLIDIVISIDTSVSVGKPEGKMNTTSDYEIIMFYALIDEAKRLKQKVGLTLWNTTIYYTTLPKVYDWRDVEKLKSIILTSWRSGFTRILFPLVQANENSDKLFLIFTDGEVYENDLINNSNTVFFLVTPTDSNYDMFIKKYGEKRVIRIDDISKIPKVTLEWYRRIMR